MEFEWDEAKRAANRAKHRLDFVDAIALFEALHVEERARTVDGEERYLAIGWMDEGVATAIFTRRGDSIRLISRRRSRNDERRRYQALHGG